MRLHLALVALALGTAPAAATSFTSISTGVSGQVPNTSSSVGTRTPRPRYGNVRPPSAVKRAPASTARSSASGYAYPLPSKSAARPAPASESRTPW